MADTFPFYDDPFDSDEPTAAERAEALRQFRADAGRWPSIGDGLDRSRLAEIEADDAEERARRPMPDRRHQTAGVER